MELNQISLTPLSNGFVSPSSPESHKTSSRQENDENESGYKDTVTLSPTARELSRSNKTASPDDQQGLNQQEIAKLQQLKRRDTEVRTHEQAHLSSAGQYARGGASYTYQKGPDGGSYAVAGEVGIDVSKESSPEATITKMRTIKRAALAPANPSAADKRIAAQASAKETQARQELLTIEQQKLLAGDPSANSPNESPAHNPTTNRSINVSAIPAADYGALKTELPSYETRA